MLLTILLRALEASITIMTFTARKIRKALSIEPQRVLWCASSNSSKGTGIEVRTDNPSHIERTVNFIPWHELKLEIEKNLLPRMFAKSSGYRFAIGPHRGKEDWLMHVVDSNGKPYGDVWFGLDPDTHQQDGLVRVGSSIRPPHTWQAYQRLSNGTYERLPSRYWNLEEVPEDDREVTPFTNS